MSWQIKIPYRQRSSQLADVVEAARGLPTDEARVVRQLVLGEIAGGQTTTAGELIDKIEAASPAERRKMLDGARERAGLKSATNIELQKELENARLQALSRSDNRLEPAPSGGFVDVDEAELEAAREGARAESRRVEREAAAAERQVEVGYRAEADRARAEQLDRELPQGFPR